MSTLIDISAESRIGKSGAAQRGVGLIEVLIAILVIAIGMLGMAGLLIASKQATYESVQRTTAAQLAEDMVTRMRINSGASELTAYVAAAKVAGGTTRSEQVCNSGSTCSEAEIVAFDLYEWERQLMGVAEVSGGNNTGGLVNPTGCITRDTSTDPDMYTVAVAWRGASEGSNPTANSCGAATGLYDGNGSGAEDVFRRVVSISFYPRG